MNKKEKPENFLFQKLKDILFEEERLEQQKLHDAIERVDQKLETRNELEIKVGPIINDKVIYMQQNFNNLFGNQVTQSIKDQIENSQDEVVEALYPIMGKMIKKYVVKEIEVLSEKIDIQIKAAFSFNGLMDRIKSWFTGTSQGEMITRNLIEPSLEEIFIIEQNSGLMIGSYSKNNTVDQDMISGMLTAIKSFAADAFNRGDESLELIEYETYKLFIKNFNSYYVVAAISGPISMKFKNELDDTIFNFATKVLKREKDETLEAGEVTRELEEFFNETE